MPTYEAADLIDQSVKKLEGAIGEKYDALSKRLADVETTSSEREELHKEFSGMQEQIDGLKSVLKETQERPSFAGFEKGKNGEREKFSFHRALQLASGLHSEDDKGFEYEKEVWKIGREQFDMQPSEVKTAINAATGAGGAFLVPTEVMTEIVPELEAMEVASQLGATVINGLTGNVTWVKEEGTISAVYVNSEEEEAGAESVTTFSNINLSPHVLAAFVPLTWSMLNQPAISMESWVSGRIMKKLALREDLSFFTGSGANSEPRGILNTTGVTASADWDLTAGTNVGGADDLTRGMLIDMVESVETANANMNGSLAWAMSTAVKYSLAKVRDADGRPLYVSMEEASPQNLLGRPAVSSTQLIGTVTADNLIFGDWSEMVIGRWGTIALAASNATETNFRRLRTTVRGVMAHDIACLQPAVFNSATGFTLSDFA